MSREPEPYGESGSVCCDTRTRKLNRVALGTRTMFLTQLSRRSTPKLEDLSMGEPESPDA
jgi:hypothetical protein